MKPMRSGAVVANERIERAIFSLDDAGLDVAGGNKRCAGVPVCAPIISDCHERTIESIRIERHDQSLTVENERMSASHPAEPGGKLVAGHLAQLRKILVR